MDSTLITVASFPSEAEASVARALLASHGIAAVLVRDDVAGKEPGVTITRAVRLAVRPGDAPAALRVLNL